MFYKTVAINTILTIICIISTLNCIEYQQKSIILSRLFHFRAYCPAMNTEKSTSTDYEEIITAQSSFSLNFKELWNYRELLFIFSWRDIKVKYKQTSLGVLWAIIQPLAMAVVFTLTVGKLMPTGTQLAIPYPVFVYSGLIHWYLFSSGVQNSSNSMLANENMIKKIYFPRLVIPFSNIMVSCFDFAITFILYLAILLVYKVELNIFLFLVLTPIALILNLITVFGIGTFLAALTIKFRDFRYTIPFLIQFFMFSSPIFYPSQIVTNKYLVFAMQFNPFNATLELTRGVFCDYIINWQSVCIGAVVAMFCFVAGIVYFRKTEVYFADLA